ncbi:MAG: ATPase, partial [Lachnospiraceae bacterium]|nr:ATPase [Lachnospiraceae bacterium]
RVPFHIQFRDYSAEELAGIAELEAEKHGFAIDEKAAGTLLELCSKPARDPDGGNGRFSRNLVEAAILSYAGRLYGTEKAPSDKNRVITAADLLSADIAVKETKKARQIGFHSDLTAA